MRKISKCSDCQNLKTGCVWLKKNVFGCYDMFLGTFMHWRLNDDARDAYRPKQDTKIEKIPVANVTEKV